MAGAGSLFRVWTARADWWDTKLDLVQRCKESLESGGISITFPQRDVHLDWARPVPVIMMDGAS